MSGSGTHVDVNEDHVLLDDMSTAIQTQIDYVTDFADTQIISLNTAITNIETALGAHTVVIDSIDTTWTGITSATFPTAPTFASLVLDEYPSSLIDDPTITAFTGIDYTYTEPIAPATVFSTFDWTAGTYSSDMWLNLFTAVHGKILGGDYGISATAHTAMVAREQTAREANQDREYQTLVDSFGTTGFNLASGHTAYGLLEWAEEILRRDQDSLNNITVKDFDIGNENEKFFITSGANLETMLRDTFEKAEDRGLEAAKATQEYIYKFLSENIKLYLGAWEGVKQKLVAAQTQVEAIKSSNESETDVFKARAEVLKTRYEGISSKNLGLLEERKTEVEVYKTQVEAVAEEGKIIISGKEVEADLYRSEVTSVSEENKNLISDKNADVNLYQIEANTISEENKIILDGKKTDISVYATQVEAVSQENKNLFDEKRTDVDVYKTEIQAVSEQNNNLFDERKSDVEVYKTEVEAVAAEYGALIDELKVWEDNLKLQVDRALTKANLNLQAYAESSKIGVSVASGIANIASQGVASSLGAINTSLSNSYSGTENRREGWSHSDSINESHSTQHDPA